MGLFPLYVAMSANAPSITQYGFDDLGDNPSAHRWRAQWVFGYTGRCEGISLSAHPVLRATPCGVWINADGYRQATKQPWEEGAPDKEWVPFQPWMKKRFVMDGSGQAWAKPTREEALHSLAIRLTRWTANISSVAEKAGSAASVLRVLRPSDADFAVTATKNLARINTEAWL